LISNYKKPREEEKEPAAYVSSYRPRMDETMDRILNREDFSYDINGDALYAHYRDNYTRMGRQAMEDTVGKVSSLTGGYGNSYAQTAGQQVYGDYMQQLNDRIPELYALALERYNAEGDALYDQYALLRDREDTEYGRYLDGAEADAEHQRWLAEFEESKRQYEQSQQMKQSQLEGEKTLAAAQLMASKGDYSLLAAYYGLTPEQLRLLQGEEIPYVDPQEEEEDEDGRPGKPPLPPRQDTSLGINHHVLPIAYDQLLKR